MTPVFLGGLLRHFVDSKSNNQKENEEKGKDQGILLSSGFIAGAGLMGVVIAIIAVIITQTPKLFQIQYPKAWLGQMASTVIFILLGLYLYRIASKSKKTR